VLCLALSFIKPSNSQNTDYSTGNLVNFTGTPTATTGNWVNGVYVQGLTCWHPGEAGNCGPYPNVNRNGTINFSYGKIDLNQVVNINNALHDAGAGVQVTGFHFGFRAKNGNGWDNGQQDFLDAYVRFYNPQAKIVESYDYIQATNKKYNWTDFNFNQTFNNPYAVNKLAAAQYGFIGKDTNNWAGPYGPEIINVNFSLNYKIDPCVANPASSPSCPGFSNLVKSSAVTIPSTTGSTTITTPDTLTSSTPVVNVGGVQLSSTGTISAIDGVPQVLKDVQAVTQTSQTSTTSVISNTPQPTKSTPNMSLIMSLISQVQANDKATQTLAVQNAQQVASTSSAKAQEQANQVVESLNTMSQATAQAAMAQANNNKQASAPTTQNTSVIQLLPPTPAPQMTFMAPIQPITLVQSQQTVSLVQPQPIQLSTQQAQSTTATVSTSSISLLPPQVTVTKYEPQKTDTSMATAMVAPQYEQPKFENKQQEMDVPTVSFNTTMSRGSNVNDLFASKINFESLQSEQSIDTVNKNVSANELAGNVDIASIATTPKGFEAYSFVLKDAAFYKVEAIYKDQKTVDNARLFRSLSNDRLHQEMVDQQYKLGN
jgi:hypothetical protein